MKAFLATLKGKIIAGALGVLVVAGGIVAAVALSGPEDYRSIKVDAVSGQTIIVDEKNNETKAYKGMNLKAGNTIEVKDGANMTLLMDSDKYMFADEGTKFKVEASGDSSKANTKTRIILEEGSVLCRIDSKLSDDETFEVETPNSVMSVRGTIFKMTIYKDENGENYARVDVLEGAVKVDLYKENGEKAGEEGLIEAGQAATVHSNTDISEFVIGDSDISYDDFSGSMAEFVINALDNGREICIGENQFKHYTGYETHPEEEIIIKEATETEDGLKDIYCPICDEIIRTETIPATGESVEEVEEVEEIEEAPAHTHAFGEWSTVETATCDAAGSEIRTCDGCDETETRTIAALGHSYGAWEETKAETCETAGEEVRTCSNNGCQSTETRTIAALGHSYGAWEETKTETCETAGEQTRTCSNSGCGKAETKTIAALGHSYGAWEETKTASCETAGEEARTCLNSGCGKTETKTIAALGHSYGSWVKTTAATCESAGVETHTCTNSGCGKTETQAIAALGHSYGSWVETTAATCETAGVETRTCSNSGCQKTQTQTIAATGHSYGSWGVTTAATCETAGVKSRTCSNSGCQKTETQAIAATGHSYGSWVVTTAATCETAGVETRTCSNSGCQKTETQVIAATGHSLTYIHEVTGSSYTDNSFTANYNGVCSTCSKTVSSEEHSGTYTSYQSPTDMNANCSCGHSFSYSF